MEDVGKIVDLHSHYNNGVMDEAACKTVEENSVNAVVLPNPYSATCLFSSQRRGRMFTLFRDPIERLNDYFEDLKNNPNFDYADMTIREYAQTKGDRPEFNYVTKLLTNKLGITSEKLTEGDLMLAKAILQRKVLVGLISDKEKSLNRFQKYFRWTYNLDLDFCKNTLDFNRTGYKPVRKLMPEDPSYKLLALKNRYDIILYEYTQVLFREQRSMFEE